MSSLFTREILDTKVELSHYTSYITGAVSSRETDIEGILNDFYITEFNIEDIKKEYEEYLKNADEDDIEVDFQEYIKIEYKLTDDEISNNSIIKGIYIIASNEIEGELAIQVSSNKTATVDDIINAINECLRFREGEVTHSIGVINEYSIITK